MPREPKKPSTGKKGAWDYTFRGFVACSLTEADRAEFYEWSKLITAEKLLEEIFWLVERGYKFSWSLGGTNNSCIATLTCNDPLSEDKGLALSGFADDLWQAAYVCYFKHSVKLNGSWKNASVSGEKKSGIG